MSEDRLQRSLNDYLDDRLDADERERFEERLASDEELGRRLASSREIRTALRSGDEELSPGFYTRTVARFAAARRRAPFGVTWSTVGLTAATIAAAAIFIPAVLREEIPEIPVAPRVREEAARLPLDSIANNGNRVGEEVESSLQSLGDVADDRAPAEQHKGDVLVEKSITAQKSKSRDAPIEGLAREDRKRQTASGAPAPLVQKRPESAANSKITGSPPQSIAQQAERLMAPELEEQNLWRDRESDTDSLDYLEASATHGSVPVPVELKFDLVGVGEVELLSARNVQQRLGASGKKENESAAPVNRFVAIGRRPGLDACSALNVRRTDEAWEISYEESGSRLGSVSCGIDLPDDGAEIRFQGWRVGE